MGIVKKRSLPPETLRNKMDAAPSLLESARCSSAVFKYRGASPGAWMHLLDGELMDEGPRAHGPRAERPRTERLRAEAIGRIAERRELDDRELSNTPRAESDREQ